MPAPATHSCTVLKILAIPVALVLMCNQAVAAEKKVYTVAGGAVRDGHLATEVGLSEPHFAAEDSKGNLYIADYLAHRIRKVNKNGVIGTLAGNGLSGHSGDRGFAKNAKISFPTGIVVDTAGNVYFADTGNARIRKIRVNGTITTVAGDGMVGYSGDGGPATSASLNNPLGLALDSSGNLYISDSGNNAIRRVNPSGIIRTVAGNGTPGFSGDGGPAKQAQLRAPEAVTWDKIGRAHV